MQCLLTYNRLVSVFGMNLFYIPMIIAFLHWRMTPERSTAIYIPIPKFLSPITWTSMCPQSNTYGRMLYGMSTNTYNTVVSVFRSAVIAITMIIILQHNITCLPALQRETLFHFIFLLSNASSNYTFDNML
jgi:hypothetical protein